MADDGKPQRTPRQQSMRTLGLFLLVFAGPLLTLRVTCVSHREICEGAGGHYGVVGNMHVCNMPESHACPPTYRYSRSRDGCASTSQLPGTFRWNTW